MNDSWMKADGYTELVWPRVNINTGHMTLMSGVGF